MNSQPNDPIPCKQIVRKPEVIKLTGISASTIRRQEKEGLFPKRHRISKRSVGWYLHEVMQWNETRETIDI